MLYLPLQTKVNLFLVVYTKNGNIQRIDATNLMEF